MHPSWHYRDRFGTFDVSAFCPPATSLAPSFLSRAGQFSDDRRQRAGPLLDLDARGANHVAQLRVFGTDQGSEYIGWLTAGLDAERREPVTRLRRRQDRGNRAVQF